jgi:hypothetical protein
MVPRFGGAFRPALGADKGEPGTDRIRTHLGKAAELGTGRFRTGDPESVVAASHTIGRTAASLVNGWPRRTCRSSSRTSSSWFVPELSPS